MPGWSMSVGTHGWYSAAGSQRCRRSAKFSKCHALCLWAQWVRQVGQGISSKSSFQKLFNGFTGTQRKQWRLPRVVRLMFWDHDWSAAKKLGKVSSQVAASSCDTMIKCFMIIQIDSLRQGSIRHLRFLLNNFLRLDRNFKACLECVSVEMIIISIFGKMGDNICLQRRTIQADHWSPTTSTSTLRMS